MAWKNEIIDIASLFSKLRTESRVQSPASKVQRPESRVQSPTSRVQSPASTIQSPVSRVQRPESSVLGLGSKVQRAESSVQSPTSRVKRPNLASRVQEFRYANPVSINVSGLPGRLLDKANFLFNRIDFSINWITKMQKPRKKHKINKTKTRQLLLYATIILTTIFALFWNLLLRANRVECSN